VATGSFDATVSYGNMVLGHVHLSLLNATEMIWAGNFTIPNNGPTGFYTISVSGNDHMGDKGSMSEVVRVARYEMTVDLKLSASVIHLSGGKEVISAKVINGNGQPVSIADIQAYVSKTFPNGTEITPIGIAGIQGGIPRTYNSMSR